MKYNYLIFIGRFQPFHIGHEKVIKTALSLASKVIVLVGSAHQARSFRNPWNFKERESFIRANFSTIENENILTFPLLDYLYNEDLWIQTVKEILLGVADYNSNTNLKIGLIGHQKDESSYYLSRFPEWEREECENFNNISSTNIRELFFSNKETTNSLSDKVMKKLNIFKMQDEYITMQNEFAFIKKYHNEWPLIFNTVSALVIQSGHILLIRKRTEPGLGLFSLPCRRIHNKEKLLDVAIKKLREEASIKLSESVLLENITRTEVFDNPYSWRGSTITHTFLIELDCDKFSTITSPFFAFFSTWVPLSKVNPEMMFEDHYQIIQTLTAKNLKGFL